MKTFPILSYRKVLGEEKCYIFIFPNKIKITNQDRLKSKYKYNFLFWDCQRRESNLFSKVVQKFSLNSNWIEVRSKTGLFKGPLKVLSLSLWVRTVIHFIQELEYYQVGLHWHSLVLTIDKIWSKSLYSMAGAIRKFSARSVIPATSNQHLTNSQ